MLDLGIGVGSPPEVRATASSVQLTFRGTSDRRSGDRDTRVRISVPKRLALELGHQLVAQAGGCDVPAQPSWFGEVLDVLKQHAGETGESEDALAVVRRLSQAWRHSHAEPVF